MITINTFVKFDAVSFLNDSKSWDDEIAKLKEEIEDTIGIKGQSDSCIRSGKISNPVLSDAIEIERIQNEINRLEKYKYALGKALGMLPEDSKEAIDTFFFKRGNKGQLVSEYGLKYGLSTKLVYAKRREALDEFTQIIEDYFM